MGGEGKGAAGSRVVWLASPAPHVGLQLLHSQAQAHHQPLQQAVPGLGALLLVQHSLPGRSHRSLGLEQIQEELQFLHHLILFLFALLGSKQCKFNDRPFGGAC